jgi:hypothetical protein
VPTFPHRSVAAAATLALAGVLALAGCSGSGGDSTDTSSSGAPSASSSGSAAGGSDSDGDSTPSGTPTPEAPKDVKPAAVPKAPTKPLDSSTETTVWKDNTQVPHLFFHSLIVNPSVAFKDRESGQGYLDYMVTVSEFKKMLKQIYAKDYVLVSPRSLGHVDANGKFVMNKLEVPKGKKPMVLSIDDVSYYEYMKGDGFATNLKVTDDGVKNTYTDPSTGKTSVGDYDVMPIVDEFVKEHPDFAPYGNKGVLAMTGYNGVLGYRTSPSVYGPKSDDPNKNIDQDIATATTVANELKKSGWEFSSHSWGHINFTGASVDKIKQDTQRWKKDVQPILGPTDLLIYPFGADISGVPAYSGPKYEYLKKAGFDFFFNVDGSTPAWGQQGPGYLRQARFNVDGLSLKAALDGRRAMYSFFDPKTVLDPARPKSVSGTS